MSTLKLSFVISAVDKATDKVKAVNRVIDKMTEPARRVRASFSALVRESRFERLAQSVGNLRERVGGLMDFGRTAVGVFTAVGVAVGGVVFALKQTADRIDQVGDTAKMLGITTEELSKMGYAAQLNGSSQEEMGDSLRHLSRNMVAAINGSKEAAEWFARVGIPVERLKKMRAPEVFEAIADKFKEVGDEGGNAEKKIAVMQALLGRSGTQLKQVLDQGSASLREFYKEAERLGAVIDTETAEAMGEFNDGVDRMRFSLFGAMAVITRAALPVLNEVVKRVTAWTVANREVIGTKVAAFVDTLMTKLPPFLEAVVQIGTALGIVASGLNTVAQLLGGWDTVIVAISAAITGKLVWALALAAKALWGVVAAFMATPAGWVVAAVTAIAGAVYLIYKHWGPIKDWFANLWENIKKSFSAGIDWVVDKVMSVIRWVADKIIKLNNMMPSWVKEYTPGGMLLDATANAVQPLASPVPSAFVASGQQDVNVGGTLRIQIDSEGRPRVTEMRTEMSTFDYDVYTGMTMVAP